MSNFLNSAKNQPDSKSAKLFAHAVLPRSGLANQLFVWARTAKFCIEHDALMLAPNFSKLHLGPILRREQDLRLYSDLFQPVSDLEITGLHKKWLLVKSKKITENEYSKSEFQKPDHGIVVFERTNERFTTFNDRQNEIKHWLTLRTREKWREIVAQVSPIQVGMHIRLGDLMGPQRHPIDWYVGATKFVQSIAGPVKISVFSDGSDVELAPILALPCVNLVRTGSAISDLFTLSNSKFIIGTGSSSFTAWATWLGQCPSMTRVGNPLSWFDIINASGRYIGEWDPSSPSHDLIKELELLGKN
jgi:hypothetical protein